MELDYPLIQYRETDFEFLKRLLSYIGIGITAGDTSKKICLTAEISSAEKRRRWRQMLTEINRRKGMTHMQFLNGKIKIIILAVLGIVLAAGCGEKNEAEKEAVSETENGIILGVGTEEMQKVLEESNSEKTAMETEESITISEEPDDEEDATEETESEGKETEEPVSVYGDDSDWSNIITPAMEEYDMSSEFVKVSIPQFPSFVGYPVEINSVLVEDVRHHCKEVYEIITSYKLEGEVTYLDEQYVSVLYQGTVYPDTSAWDIAWGTTIDIKTGEILSLEDVAELPAVLAMLEQKQFEQVRGITFDYYKELSGKEINAKEKYENHSMGSYDENHCHDFYLKEGKIGILLEVEEAVGGYIIVELDR